MKKPINRIVLIIEFSKDINKLGSPTHRTNYALIIDFICKFIDQKMIYDPMCEIGIILAGCPRNARRERIINGAFLMEPLQTVNLRLYENILLGGIPRIDEAGDVDFDRALVVALNCLEASLKQSTQSSQDNRNIRRQTDSSQNNDEEPTLNKTKENLNPNIKTEEEKQNQIIFITYGTKEVHFTPERLQRHLNLKNVTCIVIGLTFKKELFLDDLTKLREFRVNTSREIYNQTQWNEFVLLCNGSIYTYEEALNKILEPKVVEQERKRSVCRIHFIIPHFVRFNIRLYPYTNVKRLPRFTVVSKLMKKPKGKTDIKYKKNFQLDRTKKNQRQEDIIQPTFFFDKELKFDKASNVNICSKYLEDSKEILKKKRSAREAELNEISRKKHERENNNNIGNEDVIKISQNLISNTKDLSEYFRYAKTPIVPCEQIKKKLKCYTSNMPAEVRCLCVCKNSQIQSKYVVGNTYYVVGSNRGAAIVLNYLVNALKEQNSFFLALYKAKQNGRVYLVGLIPMSGEFPSLNLFFFASNEYIYYFNWKSKKKEQCKVEKEAVFRTMFNELIDVMDGTNLYKKEIKEIENTNEQNELSMKRNYDFFLPESIETINRNSALLTKNIYNLSVKIFHDMIIQKFKAFCKTSRTEYDNYAIIDNFIKPNVETRDIETLLMNKELIQSKKEQMEALKSTIHSSILYLKDEYTQHVNKSNKQSQNTGDKYCISHNLLNKVLEIGSDDNTTKIRNWFKESKTTGKIKILRDHKIYVIKNEDLWIQREKENANESTSKSVLRMLSEKIKKSLRWY